MGCKTSVSGGSELGSSLIYAPSHMGSCVGYFMTFDCPVAPKPRGVQTSLSPLHTSDHLEGWRQIILAQGIPFMTSTASSSSHLKKSKSAGLSSPLTSVRSTFCLHMCAHVIWTQTERLDEISYPYRVSLHFQDWQWQPSTVFRLDWSFIPFKFICVASLSRTLSLCSSWLQSGV